MPTIFSMIVVTTNTSIVTAARDAKPNSVAGSSRAGKRRNPFGQSSYDRKRAHSDVSSVQTEGAFDNKLFQALDADSDEVGKIILNFVLKYLYCCY